jgi:hypothetical protein
VRSAEDGRDRCRSQRPTIIGGMQQDGGLESVDTGQNRFAFFIGERAAVFMHGPGEIIRGAYKLLDGDSHLISHEA